MMEGERRGREQWRGREGGDVGRKGEGTSFMGARRQPRALPNRWCGVGASMGACHSSMGGSSLSVGGGVVAVPGRCRMWALGRRLWGLGRVHGASWWLVVV